MDAFYCKKPSPYFKPIEMWEDTDLRFSGDYDSQIAIEQDIHYTRGFAQGVWFMYMHGHEFNTKSKFYKLFNTLMKIRTLTKEGRKPKPIMCWLRQKFKTKI